jgi:hypothetical protein
VVHPSSEEIVAAAAKGCLLGEAPCDAFVEIFE